MSPETLAASLFELGTTWGVRVIGVLAALFIGWSIAGWARRSLVKGLEARKFDLTLTRFFGNALRYGILAGVILGCLGVFGIETSSFAAMIAAGGLAVGLAFQGTLSNFAAGVMLLVFRPFKVGDVITVAGVTGPVIEIELFTTELSALDNRRVIIPNSSIFGSTIENLTHNPTRRVDIGVGVVYSADIDRTRAVLNEALKDLPHGHKEPAPQVVLKELNASSVDWAVRVWCDTADYWTLREEMIRAVKMALDGAGIGIPFPQVDVHLDPPVVKALAGQRSADSNAA